MAHNLLAWDETMRTQDNSESLLLREVLECFARYPLRQDTLQGITDWWLMENRIEWAVGEVQAALDELVKRGMVLRWRTGDGQTRYKLNPGATDQVDRLLHGSGKPDNN